MTLELVSLGLSCFALGISVTVFVREGSRFGKPLSIETMRQIERDIEAQAAEVIAYRERVSGAAKKLATKETT